MAVKQERESRAVGRPRKGGRTIDVATIVAAAWRLVDEHGLAKLSTRTLAAALDVQSPALYWHVRSKEQLLSLMLEHLLHDSLADDPAGMTWQAWIAHVARRQRALLLAHRDSGMIASLAPPTDRLRVELFPRIFRPLVEAGLDDRDASATAGALAALVLGWVIYEQRQETLQFVASFHDPEEGFEFALDVLIRGVEAKAQRD
ncbi:MAG: hypothetical protein RIS94_2513 [Pseudomonadota bacterium]|jgi:TetR/AcrR family tetracycline transcriptional repressor